MSMAPRGQRPRPFGIYGVLTSLHGPQGAQLLELSNSAEDTLMMLGIFKQNHSMSITNGTSEKSSQTTHHRPPPHAQGSEC